MKILEVIPNLHGGGAENFLVSLSNELIKNENTNVTILTLYSQNNKNNEILKNKLSSNVELLSLNKKIGFDIKCFFSVYRFIKKNKFDIVHFHINAILYCLVTSILYRKCKYFATIHNDAYKEAYGVHRWARKIMFFFNLVNPITISGDSDRSFRELYKCDANIIYNGVAGYSKNEEIDISKFKKDIDTKIFVNVASVQESKNQVAMAKVFNRLVSEGENVALLFVGRITDAHTEYANKLKELLSENVHYIGESCNPRDYMIKSDYFILASHYEGLPITLLESLSVGCIPIVTAVGGNIDVVKDGYNGYIIDDPSEDSIYKTIKKIIKISEVDKENIKAHVFESVSKYNIENCAEKHLALFKSKLQDL